MMIVDCFYCEIFYFFIYFSSHQQQRDVDIIFSFFLLTGVCRDSETPNLFKNLENLSESITHTQQMEEETQIRVSGRAFVLNKKIAEGKCNESFTFSHETFKTKKKRRRQAASA